MLDFHITELEDEKKTRITQIRHDDHLANLIDQATCRLGVNKSVFLRSVIASAARRILEDSTQHVMSQEDAVAFSKALDTPPPPTARAIKAANDYHSRVALAD